jgi:hypothetical protein
LWTPASGRCEADLQLYVSAQMPSIAEAGTERSIVIRIIYIMENIDMQRRKTK